MFDVFVPFGVRQDVKAFVVNCLQYLLGDRSRA
jgi:hypothetical protein